MTTSPWQFAALGALLALVGAPRARAQCISPPYLSQFLATHVPPSAEAAHVNALFDAAAASVQPIFDPSTGYGVLAAADPRLVTAIAGAETQFGTAQNCCTKSNNDWDWGGGCPAKQTCPGSAGCCFAYSSLDNAVTAVEHGLTATYMGQYHLYTIPQIATRYCGKDCGAPPPWCTMQPNAFICNATSWYKSIGAGDPSQPTLFYDPPNQFNRCCICDCNNNGAVTIDELQATVDIVLGYPFSCPGAYYRNGLYTFDGLPDIATLINGVYAALDGCSPY